MRAEIKKVFEQTLSAETLRPLFRELKQQLPAAPEPEPVEPEPGKHESAGDSFLEGEAPPAALELADAPVEPESAHGSGSDNRKESLALPSTLEPVITACHPVGALLFSAVASQVEACVEEGGALLKQWLCAILLGAVNIEQTKLLDFHSLTRLLGRTLASLRPQRVQLGQLASTENVHALLRLNAERVGLDGRHDFYYDPHGKHYTGVQKVLKGWCAAVRGVAKTLYMDFIHTTHGHPVYVEHTDNYADLRARFAPTVEAFRRVVGMEPERVLSFVVDTVQPYWGFDSFDLTWKRESGRHGLSQKPSVYQTPERGKQYGASSRQCQGNNRPPGELASRGHSV